MEGWVLFSLGWHYVRDGRAICKRVWKWKAQISNRDYYDRKPDVTSDDPRIARCCRFCEQELSREEEGKDLK
jgi:hypothetical protein